ncbi:12887_t:CDS:1 [Dentiscutata heterogama]|uniref:12887_t:CDS:1 n=1 Tax=Dentiscutata heterogama TaxID=1316150 RepID=A0ACA9NSE4_9GLOM|nr:12887_t:CDS:1 [Dentiscutata heterogama]
MSQKDNDVSSRFGTKSTPHKSKVGIIIKAVINIIIPTLLVYFLTRHTSLTQIEVLVIAGIPSIIFTAYNLIFHRRADSFGIIPIFGFIFGIISEIIAIYTNDYKLLLLKKAVITCAFGLILIISLIPIKIRSFELRPIFFYIAKSSDHELKSENKDEPIPERWERYWKSYPLFRQTFIVLTAIWGTGLLIEAIVRVIIIFNTSFNEAKIISDAATYSLLGCLVLISIIYLKHVRMRAKKLIEERKKAAAADATNSAV